ncbi:hypothetical protein H7R52_11780 [Weissella confusa]|uniref:Uncharacterized protein n=1 Tax=Weissella confusa TaxID=1583 RepID=A0A923NGY8_WEICO|nr:hypothetical protein [Weissella confusa]
MDINLDDLKDKAADVLEGADLNDLKDKARKSYERKSTLSSYLVTTCEG